MLTEPVAHVLHSIACACASRLHSCSHRHRAGAAESVLYRLFLIDGTTLISYGEFSRVADRVVFSIPLGATERVAGACNSSAFPQASVDWERTDRYSEAVRAQAVRRNRGESDFARLSGRVTEALNQIALDERSRADGWRWPSRRAATWRGGRPRTSAIVRRTSRSSSRMLDEVISELRVAAGQSSFDLSLVANVTPSSRGGAPARA